MFLSSPHNDTLIQDRIFSRSAKQCHPQLSRTSVCHSPKLGAQQSPRFRTKPALEAAWAIRAGRAISAPGLLATARPGTKNSGPAHSAVGGTHTRGPARTFAAALCFCSRAASAGQLPLGPGCGRRRGRTGWRSRRRV